jgi:hypothetical protein
VSDAAVLELLHEVAAEVRHLRRAVEALHRERSRLSPLQRDVFAAVTKLYAPAEPFSTSTLVDAARFDPEARQALQRACGADVQRVGILLRQIADAGVTHDGLRLAALPPEAGVRRWVLEATEPL